MIHMSTIFHSGFYIIRLCPYILFPSARMKRPAQLIEVATSITENVRETPEESLRFISINNSEERITHKQTIKPAFEHLKLTKKDSFLINGWNQPNTGQSRTDRPTKRDKSHTYFGTNTITTIDTHSHKERHRSL
jgi:hypothetical protein